MGCPKHLLFWQGKTLLERTVELLRRWTSDVVLLGMGDLPESCRHLPRLSDATGIGGPLAGLLAALRSRQDCAWMILSCDLPLLSDAALKWLVGHRRPERLALLPQVPAGVVEPLCSIYEPAALPILEVLGRKGAGPRQLARHAAVSIVQVPAPLASAWRGVNTPEELAALV